MDPMAYRRWLNPTAWLALSMALGMMVGCSAKQDAALAPSPNASVLPVPVPSPEVPTASTTQPPTPLAPQPAVAPSSTTVATTPAKTAAASSVPPKDPTLMHQLRKDLSRKVAIAKQDTGKTYLSSLLLSQQAEKLVKGQFSSDLKQLSRDFPSETDEYRLEIRQASGSQAVMVAVAKQTGYASYTGAVYAQEGKIPTTGICKTNVPSQTPPPAPKLVHSVFMCATGSSAVNE
jgi:hypothetical protein